MAQQPLQPDNVFPAHSRPHILLGVAGSVAAVKVPILAQLLLQLGDVRIVATRSALHFIDQAQLPDAAKPILEDEEEWQSWRIVGDPVLHIELRRWADVLVIAPLSANTLAKLAQGMSDNLLTCIVRAWDFNNPLLVAPAMNTLMWDNVFTGQHLQVLKDLGVLTIPPVSKQLACGDIGMGAMASPQDIALAVQNALGQLRRDTQAAMASTAGALA